MATAMVLSGSWFLPMLTICQLEPSGMASSMASRLAGEAGMPPRMPMTKLKCSGPLSAPRSANSRTLAMWLRS